MNTIIPQSQFAICRISSHKMLFVAEIFSLMLVACGTNNGGISGQVIEPSGSNLNNMGIAAILCNNNCQAESDLTQTVGGKTVITTGGASASYQIANVPAGKYLVVAIQDTNGSGKPDAGDLFGLVTSPVTPPATNINITVQKVPRTSSSTFETALFEHLKLHD